MELVWGWFCPFCFPSPALKQLFHHTRLHMTSMESLSQQPHRTFKPSESRKVSHLPFRTLWCTQCVGVSSDHRAGVWLPSQHAGWALSKCLSLTVGLSHLLEPFIPSVRNVSLCGAKLLLRRAESRSWGLSTVQDPALHVLVRQRKALLWAWLGLAGCSEPAL